VPVPLPIRAMQPDPSETQSIVLEVNTRPHEPARARGRIERGQFLVRHLPTFARPRPLTLRADRDILSLEASRQERSLQHKDRAR